MVQPGMSGFYCAAVFCRYKMNTTSITSFSHVNRGCVFLGRGLACLKKFQNTSTEASLFERELGENGVLRAP